MKVLIATKETQGMRVWDMCYALEGELVMRPPVECHCPDCPRERELVGLGSGAGTTTFTVADRPHIDIDSYREMLRDELVATWVNGEPDQAWMRRFADRHRGFAAGFEVGAVLEIGDDRTVVPRKRPEQPAI